MFLILWSRGIKLPFGLFERTPNSVAKISTATLILFAAALGELGVKLNASIMVDLISSGVPLGILKKLKVG